VTDDLVEAPCASTSRQSSGSGVVYLRLAARPVAAQEIAKVDPIDEDRGDAARRWPRRASLRGLSQAGAQALIDSVHGLHRPVQFLLMSQNRFLLGGIAAEKAAGQPSMLGDELEEGTEGF